MSPLLETFGFSSVRGYRGANGAAGGSYELISTTTLASTTASVTFTNGGAWAGYKHLQIRVVGRIAAATGSSAVEEFDLRFNSDAGANYNSHRLYGNGTSVISAATETYQTTGIAISQALPNASHTTGIFGAAVIDILDHASTTKNKTVRTLAGTAGTGNRIGLHSGLWRSTAALSTILIYDNFAYSFAAGSRFSLYGVKA